MSDPGRRLLFDSPAVRATLNAVEGGGGRPLVVTFDSLAHDLRLDRPGFGEGWLAQLGYDAVHVVASANDWYQHPEMGALCAAVREEAAGRVRTVTYGSSMGGYAAVRFAGRVGAATAVAISPQFSIDPARVGFDDRWRDHGVRLEFLWDEPVAADGLERAYVFYDPADLDRRHVEALAEHYPVRAIPIRHAGHPAGAYLAEAGLLAPTVLAMIEDRFDPEGFPQVLREARRRSGQYHFTLAHRQAKRRLPTALRLSAEAVRLSPFVGPYTGLHGRLLAEAGELDEAERLLRRAMELEPGYARLRVDLAALLSRRRRHREAHALLEGVEAYGIDEAAVFSRACGVRFMAGDMAGASRLVRRGLDAMPAARELQAWSRVLELRRVPVAGPALLALARVATDALPPRWRTWGQGRLRRRVGRPAAATKGRGAR